MILSVLVVSLAAWAGETLDIHFINVGAGDAILIDCGDWEALLDSGRGYAATNAVIRDLLSEHVDDGVLELGILSHPHADHYGGFLDVLDSYAVLEFWRSHDTSADSTGSTYRAFEAALASEGLIPRELERGDQILTGQVTWTVLGPGQLATSSENDNENSLVLLLSYGDVHFLFTGDIEQMGETSLLDIELPNGPLVLKVPHHGSDTSTSRALVEWAGPELAIISTDYADPPACALLSFLNIPNSMTSVAGTIRVSTDGTSLHFDPAILRTVEPESGTAPTSPSIPLIAAEETVVITEIEMNPTGSDSGAEWIEIHNHTGSAITLAGWAVSYTGYGGGWDPIPLVTIPPGGYYQHVYPKQYLENSRGGVVQLRDASCVVVDEIPAGLTDQDNDSRTWQRFPDGSDMDTDDDWLFFSGTPGGPN